MLNYFDEVVSKEKRITDRSERFKEMMAHLKNSKQVSKEKITECVKKHFAQKPAEYWLEKLEEARIPHAPVNDFEHALSDPQVNARDMVVEIPHTEGGSFRAPGNPVKMDNHEDTWEPPPKLGEHTDEVLRQLLNMDDKEIKRLREAGTIA